MGTRSVVAEPQGDGWRGRHVHWDGYPSGVGESLLEIVRRYGVEPATQTLVHVYYGWSVLNGRMEQELDQGYRDGRFKAVPGFGIAYTTAQGQSSYDEWKTSDDPESYWDAEWVYVLYPDHITVIQVGGGDIADKVVTVAYDGGQMPAEIDEENE